MGRIFLYNHGGSENHGCEALVRSINRLIDADKSMYVISEAPQQDYHYDLQKELEIQAGVQAYSKISFSFLKAYIQFKLTGNYFFMDVLPYKKSIRTLQRSDVEISTGGDIYCYEDYPKFIKLHELIYKKRCKSILLGCSLEKKLFSDSSFIRDLQRYDYIIARESLTYNMLKETGLKNIDCYPDPAFTLPTEYLPVPDGFLENNTVGINLSPLVMNRGVKTNIVYENYSQLIKHILTNTDFSVALIPHVVWRDNDDRTVLKQLFDDYKYSKRVVFINDCNCMQLKGYISRCRFFIGARTHATIAAYSSGVPTLAVGYSVKSKGIATDLFGTWDNYVLPIDEMREKDDLLNRVKWFIDNEQKIKTYLKNFMPEYIQRAEKIKYKLKELEESCK